MTMQRKSVLFLIVQLVLVLSVAAKYAWERRHCPMVWTRTAAFDPDAPLRGRYLAVALEVDRCRLRSADPTKGRFMNGGAEPVWEEDEALLGVNNGKLIALPVSRQTPEGLEVRSRQDQSCEHGVLSQSVDYFISEKARSPFPLKQGTELWALVTVPPSGPPRPVQLAISGPDGFHPLDLR